MHTVTKMPGTNGAGSKITVTSTATSLESLIRTASGDPTFKVAHQNALDIRVESEAIRWYDDGNIPTATLGNLLEANDREQLNGLKLHAMQLISSTGNDATVTIRMGYNTFN